MALPRCATASEVRAEPDELSGRIERSRTRASRFQMTITRLLRRWCLFAGVSVSACSLPGANVLRDPGHLDTSATLGIATTSASEGPACMRDSIGAPSPTSYCIELLPVPAFPGASGTAALRRVPGPFGAALSPAGAQLHDIVFELRGLPEVTTLGDYHAYVAWATSPLLDLTIKLGIVSAGRTLAGRVALDQFIIMVSAERDANVAQRTGPLVLRGMSPSMLMQPHGAAKLPGVATAPHAHHDASSDWPMPPMHPAVTSMIPGLEPLRPAVSPFLPAAEIDPRTLPEALPRRLISLGDGDSLELDARLVRRTIGGRTFAMYGFNGQHPGPL